MGSPRAFSGRCTGLYAGLLGGLAVLSSAAPARAQIVNVLGQVSKFGEEGFGGSLAGSVSWKTGNVDLLQAGGEAAAGYRSGADTTFLVVRGTYAEKKDDLFISQTFEHLRYRRALWDWLGAEAFAQHEFDKIRRLTLRTLGGAGLRLAWVPIEELELTWGTAYMLAYEDLNEGWVDASPATTHRWSNYLQLAAQPDERLSLHGTVFAQPRFDAFDDMRLAGEAALVVKANDWVGVKVAFNISYDSEPPRPEPGTDEASLEKLDTSLVTSLQVTF